MSVYENTGPLPMEKVPTWAWATASALAALALAVAAAMVYTSVWQLDRAAVEEHRALFMAGSIAQVAQAGPEPSRRFIQALPHQELGLVEAFVITDGTPDAYGINRGQTYAAALDASLAGRELAPLATADPSAVPQAPRHKLRIDRDARVTSGYEERDKATPGRAARWFELKEDSVGGVTWHAAQIPAQGQGLSSAGATFAASVPRAPAPWGLLLLLGAALAAAGVATFTLGARSAEARTRAGIFIAATLVQAAVIASVGSWHYTDTLTPHIERRVADARVAFEAATAAGLTPQQATAAVTAADVDFTAAEGLLLAAAPPGDALVDRLAVAAGTLAQGRAGRAHGLLWTVLLLLGAAFIAGHRTLARAAVAARDNPYAYLYVLPSILGMVVLVFVPFITGIGLSAFAYDAPRYYFVGIDNFIEILAGGQGAEVTFYWTLLSTILWTASNVILHVGIGLGLALLLKDPLLRFKHIYRVLLVIPWAIPNYITALIWKGMFNKEFGAVNQLIEAVQGLLGMEPAGIDWLGGSFATAFTANLVTNTWLGFPFMMVVSLGALQSIPDSLYEAAEVDGATAWQKFRHITLPLLKPALFPAIILGSIWTFNMFNVIYLVSGGGPEHSTEILITDAYRAFAELNRYGLAAAYSVIIFLILFVYTVMTNRITRATEGAFE